MKKYPKMTFAALSAIALNFSCLATSHPLQHPDNKGTHNNNIHYRPLTRLSAREQISILTCAIVRGGVHLVENIFTGHIGKAGRNDYYKPRGGSFFVPMSDQQFEELQLFSLAFLRCEKEANLRIASQFRIEKDSDDNSVKITQKIFKLITSKFFEVTNNKEAAYQTTTSKIYNDLDSFDSDRFDTLVDLFPSDDSKRGFVRQLLNYAKQETTEKVMKKKFGDIFRSLENSYFVKNIPTPSFSIFKNQPWLQSFISEYIKQTRRDINDIPIKLIKTVAPDCYNEEFIYFLYKFITGPSERIDTLLPRNENNLPLEGRRISAWYLGSWLNALTIAIWQKGKGGLNDKGKYILSSIALYTDTSSDLPDVVLPLIGLTKKQCESVLECIKNVNGDLYNLLLEEIKRLKDMNFQPNRVAGLNIKEVQDHLLSTEEQISLLKSAISASKIILVKMILNGYIGKIDSKYYCLSPEESRQEDFFKPMSDEQFEELQLLSLDELRRANDSDKFLIKIKQKIFKLITAKFFKVAKSKEQASKTTASKVYHNLDRFEELGKLVNRCPSDDSKRAFVQQFLNDAKQDNNINAYKKLLFALRKFSKIEMFKNQPWLIQFISEYLEHMLSNTTNINLEEMPIDFIKKVAPNIYNEKFLLFLKKYITEDASEVIEKLLQRLDEKNLPPEYLNLALENFNIHFHEDKSGSKHILSSVALYTDTSSDLTNVVKTLTKFTQEECQETLKCIKDANINLYNPLLEKILPFLWH